MRGKRAVRWLLAAGDALFAAADAMRAPNQLDLLALIAIVAVTAGHTGGVVWRGAQLERGAPNHDTYAYYYPNVLYQLDSLRLKEGALWNRYQNCGQPFFAAWPGFLYPPALVFRFLAPHTGLFALMAIHLLLAGLFTYLLAREHGCGPPAALCGAFAFQLGGLTLFTANWFPGPFGAYAFLPAALLAAERGLRAPSAEAALALGAVLGLQFLAGYPPMTFYTYALLALRLGWEVVTRRSRTRPRALAAVAAGMALPLFLVAAQLYPYAELSLASVRGRELTAAELRPAAMSIDWKGFLQSVEWRVEWGAIVAVVPMALLAVGLSERATRRPSVFYLLLALLGVALAFQTPLSELYHRLPLARAFRLPHRFLWLTNFSIAVLTALGAEASVRGAARPPLRLLATVLLSGLGVLLMSRLAASGLKPAETVLAAGACSAAGAAVLWRGARPAAAFVLAALVAVNLTAFGAVQIFGYQPSDAALFSARPVFEFVRARLTLQDRIYPVGLGGTLAVQKKSASLFRIPSIGDYEPQPSQRYQELFVRMMQDRPMKSINQYFYTLTPFPKNRPLFDLLAARYVVLSSKKAVLLPPNLRDLRLIRFGEPRVLENDRALPRAFFVPRVEVIADRAALLERLAAPAHDPRAVALVEAAPPGDGLGSARAAGRAVIVEDHSESLALRVEADGAGFLFLSDQHDPGWEATVNGAPAPITRANYAFRLVRVPGGESTVVFRYRPLSVRLGAWVSAASALLLALFFAVRRARSWRSTPASPKVVAPGFASSGSSGPSERVIE